MSTMWEIELDSTTTPEANSPLLTHSPHLTCPPSPSDIPTLPSPTSTSDLPVSPPPTYTSLHAQPNLVSLQSTDILSTLSLDLVELIFTYACTFDPQVWRRTACTPILLSHVSRSWRSLVYASSALWRTLVLNIPFLLGVDELTDFIECHIERAQGRSLKLYLRHSSPRLLGFFEGWELIRDSAREEFNSAMRVLLAHTERWEDMWLYAPHTWFSGIPWKDFKFPSLVRLGVGRLNGEDGDEGWMALMALMASNAGQSEADGIGVLVRLDAPMQAPKLREVVVEGFNFGHVRVPWMTLGAVEVRGAPWRTVWGILRACHGVGVRVRGQPRALQRVCIGDVDDQRLSARRRQSHVRFVESRAHEVYFEDRGRLAEVMWGMDKLVLPRLRVLGFVLGESFPQDASCVRNLVLRPVELGLGGGELVRLEVGCPMLNEWNIVNLLMELPMVREVWLTDLEGWGQGIRKVETTPFEPETHFIPAEETEGQGLGSTFFELFHSTQADIFLPNLESFRYEGVLIVHSIDFLSPLIWRSGVRDEGPSEGVARLREVRIKAYQDVSAWISTEDGEGQHVGGGFTIAEYGDVGFVWDVVRLVEDGRFLLVNPEGERWV